MKFHEYTYIIKIEQNQQFRSKTYILNFKK
jgi:hypothetical protein